MWIDSSLTALYTQVQSNAGFGCADCIVFEVCFSKTQFRVDWIGWAIFWDKQRRLKQKQTTVQDNVLLVKDWKAGFVTVIIPASCILLVIEEKVIKVELI